MPSTEEILTEYVSPILGNAIAIVMFAAPVRDLQRAVAKGDLGDLNPSPWGFMMGSTMGWLLYGCLVKNMWVIVSQLVGFPISIYLNLGAAKLVYQGHHAKEMRKAMVALLEEKDKKKDVDDKSEDNQESPDESTQSVKELTDIPTEAEEDWATIIDRVTSRVTPPPARHEAIVLFLGCFWMIGGVALVFVDTVDVDTKALMVGTVTNLIMVAFYGAPLSTIFQVLKERNSASIHIPTMVLNTLCCFFWTVYGLAIADPFLSVPNGLGLVFSVIQIFLCMIFPRTPKKTAPSQQEDTQLTNTYIHDVETDTMVASI